MKHFLSVLVLAVVFSACSSQRLRYSAEVETGGSSKKFQFEKSYDVGGGIPVWCGLSAIFWGGACWYYLAMPTVSEEQRVREEGEAALKNAMRANSYSVKSFKTERVSWKEAAESARLD